ncbi:amidohydrolase [Diaporthe helianthi]|uniref:Amidohydrolase n=1 Tax=Diaporthe helianthi TaxID=158607 RepID=A0A2P5HNK8_DIAHE|nr:amidohydrolase [Diaporthe helianthi]
MLEGNVIIPSIDAQGRWEIRVDKEKLVSRTSLLPNASSPSPNLLLPPLCHPHIHLDKAYLLTCNKPTSHGHPDYSDLMPQTGDFKEALANTSAAKERYTEDDLYLRGSQLLADSYRNGVTSMRAFVEVDVVTKFKTVEAAVRLKRDFGHLIKVQICVFAQDPIFSGENGQRNRELLIQALDKFAGDIEALGTTPYVEADQHAAVDNIDFAIRTAMEEGLFLDFHLDYHLEPPPDPAPGTLLETLLKHLIDHKWTERALKDTQAIAIGHCTRLTTMESSVTAAIASLITDNKLPVHFVGLPTSDLYMMGRPKAPENEGPSQSHSRPRGTMQIPSMIKDWGLNGCLGVNNVGNAFTPSGNGDPLQLASWGVLLYHAGTEADAELLYGCVSERARRAIGLVSEHEEKFSGTPQSYHDLGSGVPVPGLLVMNDDFVDLPGKLENGDGPGQIRVPARQRLTVKDVVWDPPTRRSMLR